MKHNNLHTSEDRLIAERLRSSLPETPENPWFTRRVMNRLPEKSRHAGMSLWQWVFYLLGAVAFVASIPLMAKWLGSTEFGFNTLLAVASLSLLLLFCAGIYLVPRLISIVRES